MVLLPFIAAIVFTGVYPKPLLDRIEPSVEALVTHVADNSAFNIPEPGQQCGTFEVGHEAEADAGAEAEVDAEAGAEVHADESNGCESGDDESHDSGDDESHDDESQGDESQGDEGEEQGE
jgi:hypothetical protein